MLLKKYWEDIYIMKWLLLERKKGLKLIDIHLRKLGKWEQMKSQVSRQKEIIEGRKEISEMENRKTIEKINGAKIWFFEIPCCLRMLGESLVS